MIENLRVFAFVLFMAATLSYTAPFRDRLIALGLAVAMLSFIIHT